MDYGEWVRKTCGNQSTHFIEELKHAINTENYDAFLSAYNLDEWEIIEKLVLMISHMEANT